MGLKEDYPIHSLLYYTAYGYMNAFTEEDWATRIDVLKVLADAYPEALAIRNADGLMPLHVACASGAPLSIMKLLLLRSPGTRCII